MSSQKHGSAEFAAKLAQLDEAEQRIILEQITRVNERAITMLEAVEVIEAQVSAYRATEAEAKQ